MLERYVEELKALKGMIGVQLEDAIAEQDGATLPVRYRAYVQSQAEQLAVRTHKGELVVADRVQGEHFDGLEVREPFTGEVLHRFVSDGQAGWVERVEPVPVARLPEDGLAAAGEQLVSEDPDIARKALEYVAADVPGHQLADLIDEHVHALRRLAGEMSGVAGLEQLKTQLDTLGDDWGQRRTDLLIELYDKTPRPGVDALVFMHAQGLLEVRYQGPRQQLANGTAMDEYRIRRIGQGKKTAPTLWVAHFHFEHLADGATDFVRGHLKTWQQRSYGRADAHKLAAGGQRIHRGRLTYEQVRHIFPFH
ncbi:hypothetical protein [Pseudomonas sichuanensis]|uniref:Uncharacterized protein n=1 Tax=Pseudomonas sichuanensis TaxID=2213015 RepID=A0ABV0DID4_9PSED